jgi:Fur family ferric uptake transcriptional regulator
LVFIKPNEKTPTVTLAIATPNIEDIFPTIVSKGINKQRGAQNRPHRISAHCRAKLIHHVLRNEIALTNIGSIGCEPARPIFTYPLDRGAAREKAQYDNAWNGIFHRTDCTTNSEEKPGERHKLVIISCMTTQEHLAADLKNTGLKVTVPRLKVLSIFEQSKTRHLSAEDVYKVMLAENMDVGLATVYRVLTQFEQAGILLRSHFESGKAVFELNQGSHHDHLVCLDCGRVEEFFDAKIEDRQHKIAEEKGFALQDHSLALYGQCQRKACPHKRSK